MKINTIVLLLYCFSGLLLAGGDAYAATWYVDDDANYYIDWSDPDWAYLQPSAEWRFADGIDWDTTGTGVYRNYGSLVLTTGLTDVNQPGLNEGILRRDQSVCDFDGVNDYLHINDNTILDMDEEDFSVSAWVFVRATGYRKLIVNKKVNTGSTGRGWMLLNGEGNYFWLHVSDGTGTWLYSRTNIVLNEWVYLTATFDWSEREAVFYLNGVLKLTRSEPALASPTTTKVFSIGGYSSGNNSNQMVALVQVWEGITLSEPQVDSLYDAMAPTGALSLPFPSFQSAVYKSSAGDSILGLAGRYQETVLVSPDLIIISSSNAFGSRAEFYGADLPASSGYSGLTIRADVELGYLDIRGYTNASGYGVYADSISDGSIFHHLVIDSCKNAISIYGSADNDSIINCSIDGASLTSASGVKTVDSGETGPFSISLINNVVTNFEYAFICSDEFDVSAEFNNTWDNDTDYSGVTPGEGSLYLPPFFVAENDYRLAPVSPVREKGRNLRFTISGRRADIGAFEDPTYLICNGLKAWGRISYPDTKLGFKSRSQH